MFDVYNDKDYKIVCWKIEKLQKVFKNITNWSYNREADSSRINSIREFAVSNNLKIVPGIISAWENSDNSLEIYDGFHRYSAFREFKDCKILIKITTTLDEELIKKDFENVNKSLYVPAMYLENNLLKNKVCQKIFELMKNTFPRNVSQSNNPQQQNFNQNSIIDIVKDLKVDWRKQHISNKIYLGLLQVNEEIKNLGIKPRYRKTLDTNFWLLFWDNEKIIARLSDLM